jgi:hypothetical protein
MSSGPITLEWGDDEGHHEPVVLSGPGGTIRVVVGEPGRQSGIWRIWADRNKFDVYIAIRTTVGNRKWSLHESGQWHFAWVDSEKAKGFGWDQRFIDTWQAPDEDPGNGYTTGFTIRVRHQDLVVYDEPEDVPANAMWVAAPPAGQMVSLHVMLVTPDRGITPTPGLAPIAGFTLCDGRALLLFAGFESVSAELNQSVDSTIKAAHDAIRASGVDVDNVKNPRMTLAGYNDGGHRFVWDAAVPD